MTIKDLGREFADERAMLADAVMCVLQRGREDPDVGYVIGPGTEAFRRLTHALAAHEGKTFEEIERWAGEDAQPRHRRREPEVLELRKRIQELDR